MKRTILILALLFTLSSCSKAQFFPTHTGFTPVKYGYLYNTFVVTDAKNVSASGWKVAIVTETDSLKAYLGGYEVAGGKLKETGTTHWTTPNTGATNETKFNLRPSGYRVYNGTYTGINITGYWMEYPNNLPTYSNAALLYNNNAGWTENSSLVNSGFPIRLKKIHTNLSNGQTGIYRGNDGKIYPTICVGTQEWMACNLAETKYRDGTAIPTVTNGTTWAGLTTGAKCAYSNDESYVLN